MATKTRPKIRTVWDECLNRSRCREGLRGVAVRLSDGSTDAVRSSRWNKDGELVITTEGGRDLSARECALRTTWPVACCPPAVRHRLNSLTLLDRQQVLERDGYACRKCGAKASDGVVLHIDHVHPVSKGGTDRKSNLQVLCMPCNLEKRDHVEEE